MEDKRFIIQTRGRDVDITCCRCGSHLLVPLAADVVARINDICWFVEEHMAGQTGGTHHMSTQEIGWAVLELMGHVRLGGFVTEEERFGGKIGRIDTYGPDGVVVTQYFSGTSVYRITPTTEMIAKAIGAKSEASISRWELRALEPANAAENQPLFFCEICDSPVSRPGEICTICQGGIELPFQGEGKE